MTFLHDLFKGSSCGCKKTRKRSGSKRMRGGYQFSLNKTSSNKRISLSSNRLVKKHSKSNGHSKSKR